MKYFAVLLFVAAHLAVGQDKPVWIPNSRTYTLPSKVVGLAYKLYVKVPPDYDSEKAYDMIFTLDPEYSFAIESNITDHLVQRNDLPPVIIVGIGYEIDNYRVNRTRDYTPTKSLVGGYDAETQKHTGGGENFFRFITTELFPFIEKNFGKPRTRTLVGHSYGGLFASWVMFNKPGTFDRSIIVSPSLWFDEKKVLKGVESNSALSSLEATVYITAGNLEDAVMANDVLYLKALLDKIKPSKFRYRAEVCEGENHNTIFPRAFSNGLRFTFRVR
ncbi:MAG TPA: alpha/beta hydrolase-fold protein [Cyclobacteriaceae bacterium]|nr:alpha/beta hydrolase-fold protein [Cyclobacteriaceae bacterium]